MLVWKPRGWGVFMWMGIEMFVGNMKKFSAVLAAATCLATAQMLVISQAKAASAGDLLVAPTRVVFEGSRGTEVILNNIGSEAATYRISLELRRMNAQGGLDEISEADATENEKLALGLVRFAPKRVTLAPDQPQSIRVGLNPSFGDLADGEYRVHLLFRAIPKAAVPTASDVVPNGVQIQLIPIYGVTIPLIIRKGNLQATAAITNPRMANDDGRPSFEFDMSRTGNKSVYGNVFISKPGVSEPIWAAKGIAIYPEADKRLVTLPITPEAAARMSGPIIISYNEPAELGGGKIAEVKASLP
jgi:P pilus assembly chaperone PapD